MRKRLKGLVVGQRPFAKAIRNRQGATDEIDKAQGEGTWRLEIGEWKVERNEGPPPLHGKDARTARKYGTTLLRTFSRHGDGSSPTMQ